MAKVTIFGEEIEYKPYYDKLGMHKLKIRLANDKTLTRAFKYNLTDPFFESLKNIVNPKFHHEENSVLSVYGLSGTGKSQAIMSICKIATPDRFTYKNMCFFDSHVLKLASQVERDTFIVRDEGVDKAVYGVGSQRTSRQLQVMVETCRKYGISPVFIEPEFRRNEMAKQYLETLDIDYENRITRLILREPSNLTCIGSIYVPVLANDDKDWVQYNLVKDKFISDMREGKLKESKEDYRTLAKNVLEKMDLEVFRRKKDRLNFIRVEFSNYTNSECDIIATFVEVFIKNGTMGGDDE
jgi:ABC-type dipeptide/oligopeptide/nickel transport system ATPase component